MIYVVVKHLKIKQDKKQEFSNEILSWIKETKKQEYNLSLDGCWKNNNNFILLERWSTKEEFDKFMNKKESKADFEKINKLLIEKPLVLKYDTII